MKPIVIKYIIFILVKYIIFYAVSMSYDKVEIVNTSFSALIYGLLLLSILPFVEIVVLGIPTIWILLKSKTYSTWIFAILLIFGLELILTVGLTQNQLLPHHIWKLVISVATFLIIYRSNIWEIIQGKKSAHNNI